MAGSLPILNLTEAKFECIYGRGCDGICCQEGEPPVYPEEVARIEACLDKALPELRPTAQAVIKAQGFLGQGRKLEQPMLGVVDNWCLFFNQGCVLHKIGAMEGDKYKYKPSACALFPLTKDEHDRWYVRQKDYQGEEWNLFCLDPNTSPMPASQSLGEEIALAAKHTAG